MDRLVPLGVDVNGDDRSFPEDIHHGRQEQRAPPVCRSGLDDDVGLDGGYDFRIRPQVQGAFQRLNAHPRRPRPDPGSVVQLVEFAPHGSFVHGCPPGMWARGLKLAGIRRTTPRSPENPLASVVARRRLGPRLWAGRSGSKDVKRPRSFRNGSMQIVFLGTSGSWPTPKRNVSAVAVKRGPEVILFDCGEGTQRQFMQSRFSFMQVSRVFISHFHGDHFLGLPGMVQSMSMNGREVPLDVHGPRGVERLVGELLSLGYFTPGFAVRAKELPPGGEVDCGEYTVKAYEAVHTVPGNSYVLEEKTRPGRFSVDRAEALGIPTGPMYSKLQEGETVLVADRTVRPEDVLGPPRRGRKIVYTGDTMPHDDLVEIARHADVLIHDAT